MRVYSLQSFPIAIVCGLDFSSLSYVRDEETFHDKLQKSFEHGFTMLTHRLKQLQLMERVPTEQESKELEFMISELIELKQMLYEEEV